MDIAVYWTEMENWQFEMKVISSGRILSHADNFHLALTAFHVVMATFISSRYNFYVNMMNFSYHMGIRAVENIVLAT